MNTGRDDLIGVLFEDERGLGKEIDSSLQDVRLKG